MPDAQQQLREPQGFEYQAIVHVVSDADRRSAVVVGNVVGETPEDAVVAALRDAATAKAA